MKKYLIISLFQLILIVNFVAAQSTLLNKRVFTDQVINLTSAPNFGYETNPNNTMKRGLQPIEMVWYYEILLTKYSQDEKAASFLNKQLQVSKSKIHK